MAQVGALDLGVIALHLTESVFAAREEDSQRHIVIFARIHADSLRDFEAPMPNVMVAVSARRARSSRQ